MKYIKHTLEFHIDEPAILSLGKFDGLHLGHKYLLKELQKGKEAGLKSVIFTFDIPPRSFSGEACPILSTNEEKQQIFEEAGIDYVIECPFTNELRQMEPEAFLRMLTAHIPVKKIVAGTDFRFGKERSGGPEELKKYADSFGYEAIIVEKMQYEGADISSSRIRGLLEQGDIEKANTLLGYPYFFLGPVLHGNEIGRTIGFPTANQIPSKEKLLPPNGVYAVEVTVGQTKYAGMANIGCKPSIAGEYPIGVETHIFDFDEKIYDEIIQVAFLKYLRPERKFASLEELKTQIAADMTEAKKVSASEKGAREKGA